MTVTPLGDVTLWTGSRQDPFTPLWWASRLLKQLQDRAPLIQRYNDYYRGRHPLPWLAPQAEEAFRRILEMTRTNYMGLVVDATTERLEPMGFRVGGSTEGDAVAWRIWQANGLDAHIGDGFLEAVKTGSSFVMLEPNPVDASTPRITIEHPSQVVVEYEPGDVHKRAAGLKAWTDDRLGVLRVTLFLPNPGRVYKWEGRPNSAPEHWTPRRARGETWPILTGDDEIPIVELRNNPQWTYDEKGLRYGGVSEICDVLDSQDRINKTIADRLMTQDYGAFPQRWANNWPADDDDDDSPGAAVDVGRDRLVVSTGDTQFGQFTAAALDPYSTAKTEDVKDIASRTRTPSQYLLGEIVNVSADALQAAESGLVSKVKQRQRPFAEAIEEVMRLALRYAGDPRADDQGMELIWRDPEFRSVGALTDAIVKKLQVELISKHQALEDSGYTPAQIERIIGDLRVEATERAEIAAKAARLAIGPGGPAEPGQPATARPPSQTPDAESSR